MDKLFNDFGFEWPFFVAQIINFLILAVIFKKFLYKPILKVLRDREKKIAQGIADAELATKELEKAETRKDEIIRAATLEAEKIIEETKKSANDLHSELTQKAKDDSVKIIKEAKMLAEEEAKRIETKSHDAALDIAKSIVEKILSELFTKDERQKIMARDIKKIADL